MTDDRDFKILVRARMAETGLSYTAAWAQLRPPPPATQAAAPSGEPTLAAGLTTDRPAGPGADPRDADPRYAAARAEQRRLVAPHLRGGRLLRIPARRKSRVAVLLELLARFEPGRSYPEPEVNELLGRVHEDVAWLRRELVDYRLLTRAGGVYRVCSAPPERHGFERQEVPAWEQVWLPTFLAGAATATHRTG